jgi:murein DD-endopeptidase MepM/ murein hydrolase activator NlpD
MILYILKSALCLTLLIGVYQLLLARAGTFRFNRFFLLFGICFSLTIPLIEIGTWKEAIPYDATVVSIITDVEHQIVAFENHEMPIRIGEDQITDSKSNMSILLLSIYMLVVLILIIRYARNIRKLLLRNSSTITIYHEGVKLNLLNENIAPHSFLNRIFIGKEDYRNGMSTELLTHELAHVQQRHTLDILFVEMVKIIFWFNPVLHQYAKAIRVNHEYLADRTVIESHKNVTDYQHQLLQYLSRFKSPAFASQLNYSLTKKRFEMMKKKISKTVAVVSIVSLIPVMLIALVAFSPAIKKAEESIETEVVKIETLIEPIELVEENYTPSISPLNKADVKRVPSGFGQRLDPFTKEKKWHFGIDFSADTGVDVLATADGVIAVAEIQKNGYGNHVRIHHGNGYETLYAHMNELKVSVDEKVKMGDVIGTVGSSGKSAAPHLHYAVIKDDRHVNPVNYIPGMSTAKVLQQEVPGTKYQDKPKSKRPYTSFTIDSKRYVFRNIIHMVFRKKPSLIHHIMYNDSIGVVMYYGREPMFRNLNEFTEEEKSMLNAPPQKRKKVSPTKKQLEDWLDPNIYGVWLDGVRISNEKLKAYKPDDFSSVFISGLEKNAKNYGKYNFHVSIDTNEVVEQRWQKAMKDWEEREKF